ncbi:ADP-glyceromanno-heptose 6-epimerase [candidate division WOR-1 bacterium RIFCSPLOWO2_02_FULL_46_20]|uniref:ADP-L-glycero-D-manno-heptose-6-epimerase n=1 Tax=candidate division WOR-1 bacterium RIFCSPLOWO2_02_FULL_46_20 TaxID=1802567 RepID=A0A1F4RCB7_UNCSA|nr:MAG: ADP-glyceromanno-heptose 6-epimerase [candidate division WOR-1 bacterium RIFCSPHIGHO2_02_FULL_45_12]OGC05835.1 MAG: ADP-glyceromanno-heptose 6-epimerase [candidate division WOR-1 bacterium RIFCSPLOWO2_02_FULL_46_20]
MAKQRSDQPEIILTGGAGFIGSCFLWKLNQAGENNIIVVDELDSDLKKKNLEGKKYSEYLNKDDFIQKLRRGAVSTQAKALFHIGACSSTMETDANFLTKNNFEYSKTLANWALSSNVPFYYASSAATYGDGSLGYSDEDSLTPKLRPLNLYGQSKHKFDVWLIENKFSDKVVGFRYFNVFGPNEYHKGEMRSLVVKAYEQIKRDGKIRLFKSYKPEYKNGEQKRDFVYVKDVINLMYKFYKNGKVKGIFNVGTGQARSWNDLAKSIFAALGMQINIEYIEMPELIKDKYQYFTEAKLAKLHKSGFKYSFTPLAEAIADYVKNYLDTANLTHL